MQVLVCLSAAAAVQAVVVSRSNKIRIAKLRNPAENDTAILDGVVSGVLSGSSLEVEYKKLPASVQEAAANRGAAGAAEELGVSAAHAGMDVVELAVTWAKKMQTQRHEGAEAIDETSIRKGIVALNKIMSRSWQQIDDRVVACKAMKEKDQLWRAQLEMDLVGASHELARITGMRTQSTNGIQLADIALAKVNRVYKEELDVFNKTMARINQTETLLKDDVKDLKKTVKLAKCPAAASSSFLSVSGHAVKSFSLWLCQSNATGRFSFYTNDAKELNGIFQTLRSQQMLSNHFDSKLTASIPALLQNSSLADSVPHELQHLKCSIGRLGCATVQLAAMRLLADSTDALEDLHSQARQAERKLKIVRKRVVKQQKKLRVLKMQLEEELTEAVSKMSAANTLRRSLAEQIRAHVDGSRSHYKQCKTDVRVNFETVCSLRKVRSSLASKSKQIDPDDVVDCDVTDWQRGECSLRCDDACPNESCGGLSTLTREIIQKPADLGMDCPALTRTIVCNQIKCPVPCKVSEWSQWEDCTRECGGGVSTRTRKLIQLPKHGGEVCGATTETKPCNSQACTSCNLKAWSNWTECSAVCAGGFQVRTREPVEPEDVEEDSTDSTLGASDVDSCPTCYLGPPVSFVEMETARCPAASDSERYEKRACMAQACEENDVCIGNQDIVLAIDSSASLSPHGFGVLRAFVVSLVKKFKAPTQIGVMQFGGGALLDDGSISNGLLMMPITSDLSKVALTLGGMQLLNGFPYMPPLLDNVEEMFKGARQDSEKMLLLVTNSKPLFKEQTFERARRLRKKGIRIFVLAASDFVQSGPLWEKVNDDELSKQIPSEPVTANFFHIPALSGPGSDPSSFVSTVIGRTCRKLESR